METKLTEPKNRIKLLFLEWTLLMANFWGGKRLTGFISGLKIYEKKKFMKWEILEYIDSSKNTQPKDI